jgi:putative hydrolase of the HAD superfamily
MAEVEHTLDQVQRTDEVVRKVGAMLGLRLESREVGAVVEAMSAPGLLRDDLFDGGDELLRTIRELGLKCAVVSNTFWRSGNRYREDFRQLGIGEFVDVVITSLDLGVRKPNPLVFEAALRELDCRAGESVMIGNSEEMDVRPAKTLGMRTIRLAFEETSPRQGAADAVVTSLADAAAVLRAWVGD